MSTSGDYSPERIEGYRPFHALTCEARTSYGVDGHCTCGGLDDPVWNPGDEPAAAQRDPA